MRDRKVIANDSQNPYHNLKKRSSKVSALSFLASFLIMLSLLAFIV